MHHRFPKRHPVVKDNHPASQGQGDAAGQQIDPNQLSLDGRVFENSHWSALPVCGSSRIIIAGRRSGERIFRHSSGGWNFSLTNRARTPSGGEIRAGGRCVQGRFRRRIGLPSTYREKGGFVKALAADQRGIGLRAKEPRKYPSGQPYFQKCLNLASRLIEVRCAAWTAPQNPKGLL